MAKTHQITLTKLIVPPTTTRTITSLLNSGQLVQGPLVTKLEQEFARLCGTKFAVAVNNGTAALHAALLSLGIGSGDEVITTPFTFVATVNSILMTGATPVFVDIDPLTFNLDSNLIESVITKKTKAILPVNLFGLPADYKKLNKITKKHKLFIIEDAAQSVAATYKGKVSGSLGDVGCFSLYATKNLFCGEGGMVTTNSLRIAEKLKQIRHHGQSEKRRYYYFGLGYNYRLTDIAAAIALDQLKILSANTKRRQVIASRYNQKLSHIQGIITPSIPDGCSHVFHQYTLRLTKKYHLTRDQFQAKLSEQGIQTNIYYPKVLTQFPHIGKYTAKHYPEAQKAAREVIPLPVHPYLTDQEVNYVIKIVSEL